MRSAQERVLFIADVGEQVRGAIASALPAAHVKSVGTWFDAIAELAEGQFTTVMGSVEPIERRPERAVRTVRKMAGDARFILFGHPTLEPLSRKMLEFGVDDYLVAPAGKNEIDQVFGTPRLRIAPTLVQMEEPGGGRATEAAVNAADDAGVLLDALLEHPDASAADAVRALNDRLERMRLYLQRPGDDAPAAEPGRQILSSPLRGEEGENGQLHLIVDATEDVNSARRLLARLAELLGKVQVLQERHQSLKKLAITDELTGLYNARYFKHSLGRIIEHARSRLSPVTLLIFDIDDFKKYNDQYGHAVGDDILRQTAALMKRCCREHDLVARLGGDEFAVVFWEKEGPRQVRDPNDPHAGLPSKPPRTPESILERFRKMLAKHEFAGLGPEGKGCLTISGGLAVFPYHANTMRELIELADKQLMFGAKRSGKNSILLVGEENQCGLTGPPFPQPPQPAK